MPRWVFCFLGDNSPLYKYPPAVPVWLEYAKFAVDKMSVMPEGMEFPRDVFERAIIACGLHVNQVRTWPISAFLMMHISKYFLIVPLKEAITVTTTW